MPDFHVVSGPFGVPSSVVVDDKEYNVGETVVMSDDQADALRRQGFTIGEGAAPEAPEGQSAPQVPPEQPAEAPQPPDRAPNDT